MEIEHLEIIIYIPINSTEDIQKVVFAVKNILPSLDPLIRENKISVKVYDFKILKKIKDQIRSKRTLSVLQRILYNNYNMKSTWFLLNKQAAFSGVVAIVENEDESPLGPIKITINNCDLEKINEWFENN